MGRSSGHLALALGTLLASFAGATGCVSDAIRARSPEQTVRAFSQALSRGNLPLAYAMMSTDYRKRVPQKEFERLITENQEETVAMTEALSRQRGNAPQQAVIQYDEHSEIRLERHGQLWLITNDVVNFYSQATPRDALRSFVLAMERRRYDVIIRLVPHADKEGITTEGMRKAWSGEAREEVERMLSNLRNHLDAPIEIVGQHATMPYGDHMRVQFVREQGAWKIEDPE